MRNVHIGNEMFKLEIGNVEIKLVIDTAHHRLMLLTEYKERRNMVSFTLSIYVHICLYKFEVKAGNIKFW